MYRFGINVRISIAGIQIQHRSHGTKVQGKLYVLPISHVPFELGCTSRTCRLESPSREPRRQRPWRSCDPSTSPPQFLRTAGNRCSFLYAIESSSGRSAACTYGKQDEAKLRKNDAMPISSGEMTHRMKTNRMARTDAATKATNLLMLRDVMKRNWAMRKPTPHI
jgi:hypothetical protein